MELGTLGDNTQSFRSSVGGKPPLKWYKKAVGARACESVCVMGGG